METNALVTCAVVLMVVFAMLLLLVTKLRRSPLSLAPGFKAVLITGCDQGFGHLLAKRLDGAGYKVFAGCLDANGEGAVKLREETSSKLDVVQLDVTNDDQIEAARATVAELLEGHVLWAVVNNAGLVSHNELELTPKAYFRKMIDVNLMGVVNVTRAFLPLIRATKGRVVNVASMAGRTALPGFTAYSASKFGVVGFSESLRREMAPFGVKVALVEPFIYKTAMGTADTVVGLNDTFWDVAEPGVKRDYGEYFFTKSQDARRQLMENSAIPRLYEVIDCLEHAVSSPAPKPVYVPPWPVCILNDMLNAMPYAFQDWVLGIIMGVKAKPDMTRPVENGGGPRTGRRRSHAL